MFILVATMNFNYEHIKSLMHDIYARLSCKIRGLCKLDFIERTIFIGSDIRIVFKPALAKKVKGLRPDYFWSNSYDCDDYLRNAGSKELKNFDDLVNAVKEHLLLSIKNNSNFPEIYKTCSRCIHAEDNLDIVGSTCYLCKRNPYDHRIDWFEQRKDEELNNDVEFFHAIWNPDRTLDGVFCPRCGTWMDDYNGQPDKCPNCGVELDGWIDIRDYEKEKANRYE